MATSNRESSKNRDKNGMDIPFGIAMPDLQESLSRLERQARKKPYQSMAIAMGVGVIFGGGMWRFLAASAFNAGARFAIATAATSLLNGFAAGNLFNTETESKATRSKGESDEN